MAMTMKAPINAVKAWLKAQPPKMKVFLALVVASFFIYLLHLLVEEQDNLFVAAEAVHAFGISVLVYKLTKGKSCAGLSLISQELTAMFLAVRLYCSIVMEYDIHTVLDMATLAATIWVAPCVLLAMFIHPSTNHHIVNRVCWAFCVYLEAVSVYPQLHVMQNTKIIEPFTANYVFALGISRFLSCAHWILQILDTQGTLLTALGYGLWPSMVILSEIIQTFILADFCYYYAKWSAEFKVLLLVVEQLFKIKVKTGRHEPSFLLFQFAHSLYDGLQLIGELPNPRNSQIQRAKHENISQQEKMVEFLPSYLFLGAPQQE
nr:putative ER lumen protein-retaining receptor C28H8.4 [Ipomoea batatas]